MDEKTSSGKLNSHTFKMETSTHADTTCLQVQYLVKQVGLDVNAADICGHTPLHVAYSQEDNEIVNFLLLNGANPNFKDLGGFLPIEYHCSEKRS